MVTQFPTHDIQDNTSSVVDELVVVVVVHEHHHDHKANTHVKANAKITFLPALEGD